MAVSIYTTPSCGYCNCQGFSQKTLCQFTEYNVAQDVRKAEEMVHKSGQMGVPVLDINGRIIVGFNQPEIEKH